MKHKGKWAGNAEVEIDYINKKVSFNYPAKRNENMAYFTHSFYRTVGYLFGVGMLIIIVKWIGFLGIESLPLNFQFLIVFFIISCVYGGRILFGYISLFIHKISPVARNAFPKTNAIPYFFTTKKKIIDLKEKYSKNHYVDKNKLILFNYDIAFFKFQYEGNNDLLKLNTKSVEKKNKKGEHYDFIAIFTFRDLIKGGTLSYC